MTESYSPVTISRGPLSTALLQRMANNDDYLFQKIPKMRYAGAVTRNDGLKILAGKVYMPPNDTADRSEATVYFGSFFSQGCSPVVTAVIETLTLGRRTLLTVRGLSGGAVDSRGAIFHGSNQENALSDQTRLPYGMNVNYIAVGW